MGISRIIHELNIKRVLACLGIVCMCILAIFTVRYVFMSDVTMSMEPSGKQVGKTEANIVLTVNIRVRKLSERRFGGYDSNSSVRFYPPWSGGAADSALFISTQLQIGGVERNPGPEYNGDSPGEDARTPFNWSQLCATAYPIYDCQRFSGTNNVQPAIIRCGV